jgi:hypothetical protein
MVAINKDRTVAIKDGGQREREGLESRREQEL